jgi:putative redox protein
MDGTANPDREPMALDSKTTAAGSRDVVTVTHADSYRTTIDAGGFELVADEPAGAGSDAGPNPYDYLLVSLGACTGMTLRMYAARKKWPLESVTVRMRHGRKHADDCEHCEEPGSNLAQVQREIELIGALDDAQRARLMQIADMCPVHRSLEAGFRITSTLVGHAGPPAAPGQSAGA